MLKRKNVWYLAALVVVAFSGAIVTVIWNRVHSEVSAGITPEQLQAALASGDSFTLVDVRRPNEYQAGHIAGAFLVPLSEFKAGVFPYKKTDEIVLYCRTGHRSKIAMSWLTGHGYVNVRHLEGGILAWKFGIVTGNLPGR